MSPRRAISTFLAALGAVALVAATLAPTAAAAPQVSWSDRDVVAGADVRATVQKSSRPAGSTLVLERKYLDAWRVEDNTAEESTNGFVLDVPTDQFGEFTYRVVARSNGDVESVSDKETITVRPPYDPVGRRDHHVFSSRPRVRWDSCQPIRWTFHAKNAPTRGLQQVREGVRRIHLATGHDFTYVGRTDQKPSPYGDNVDGADVIIGWRTAKDFAPFARNPGTVGLGGNMYYSGFQEADGTKVNRAVQGGVVLNASKRSDLGNGFGRGATWGEVIIHELGHVMGLAHPESDSQIMYFTAIRRDADWGAGDLAGLRTLGDTRGCLDRAPSRVSGPGRSRLF
jgi:hypothetical protein